MTTAVLAFPTVEQEAPPGTLTPQEACRRSGASYRQLDYWARVGLVDDVRPQGNGTGYRRYFEPTEVAVLVLVVRLIGSGLDVRPAFDHARRLLADGATVRAGITIHLPEDL